jgi:hypothetical protein
MTFIVAIYAGYICVYMIHMAPTSWILPTEGDSIQQWKCANAQTINYISLASLGTTGIFVIWIYCVYIYPSISLYCIGIYIEKEVNFEN